jgi:hypothetical protein
MSFSARCTGTSAREVNAQEVKDGKPVATKAIVYTIQFTPEDPQIQPFVINTVSKDRAAKFEAGKVYSFSIS